MQLLKSWTEGTKIDQFSCLGNRISRCWVTSNKPETHQLCATRKAKKFYLSVRSFRELQVFSKKLFRVSQLICETSGQIILKNGTFQNHRKTNGLHV